MNYVEFEQYCAEFNFVPVYEMISADFLTPVLAYLKIRKENTASFLLESVEGIGRLARYSFIGIDPAEIISNEGTKLTVRSNNCEIKIEENLFDYLKKKISCFNYPTIEALPYFTGGITGFIGFENVSLIEEVLKFEKNNDSNIPDSILGFFKTIVAFDHLKRQIILITNVDVTEKEDLPQKYSSAKIILQNLRYQLSKEIRYKSDFKIDFQKLNHNDEDAFLSLVEKCKINIHNGDVIQIVLSKRFEGDFKGDSFNIFRALRTINPSPYMYYMEFENDLKIIGTSPEDLLKVNGRKAEILPIAGTRRRGKTKEEDLKLEKELLNDPKEIAEHTMLVDLARNDLGRVCKYGSICLSEKMKINRFSHVMHIVSRVEGILNDQSDCIDALKAAFPAGTVTGAPKIRAIELIKEYEKMNRSVYAGAVGYIDFRGNLDMCIAIRTFFSMGSKIFWQAGAGIVADSVPELEYKEILNKSAVLINALKNAEVIDENSFY